MIRKIPKGCFIRDGKVICPKKKKKITKAVSRNKTIDISTQKRTDIRAVC